MLFEWAQQKPCPCKAQDKGARLAGICDVMANFAGRANEARHPVASLPRQLTAGWNLLAQEMARPRVE
jgi:hypothetical protein